MAWTHEGVLKAAAETLSPANRERATELFREKRVKGDGPGSIYNHLRALRSLDRSMRGRPLDRATGKDLIRWVESLQNEGKEDGTIKLYKTLAKQALRRWNGKTLDPDVEAALSHRANGRKLPADSLITREELAAAVGVAKTSRDRALLLTLYESAFRAGEMVALNVGSVAFDGAGGAEITIPERTEGVKTGGRSLWVFDAAPDLKIWLNQHPHREDVEAALWISLGKHNRGGRMGIHAIHQIVTRLFRDAGIKRKVWPHLLRHSRLTELAANLAESDLRIVAGWGPTSDMPATYVHRSAADVKRKLKRLKGVATEEEKAREDRNPLAPAKCPDLTCGTVNPAGFTFCGRCGGPLTAEAARRKKETMAPRKKAAADAVAKGKGMTIEALKEELRAQVLEDLRAELVGKKQP